MPASAAVAIERPEAAPDPGQPHDEMPVTEEKLRRWLGLLRQPDRLAEVEDLQLLLEVHDRLPENGSEVHLGRAAADLLRGAIEGLEPTREAPREEWLPYEVLKTCFLEGATRWQAANKLGLSERQMSRERTRAIKILRAELEAPAPKGTGPSYRPEPIPAILGFMARPSLSRKLKEALEGRRLVRVHGPPGVGKSSLVAELATDVAVRAPTFWYRFRAGLNDSMEALLFELGEYLRSRRRPELALYIAEALPRPDPGLATRLALKGLAGTAHLLVLDDCHVADGDRAIGGFLEEAVARLPELRVVAIGRHRDTAGEDLSASLAVPALSRTETQALLAQLGVETAARMADTIHSWTDGIPHLVKLAASWLKTVTPSELEEGVESLGDLGEVQEFLLESITELMGPDERVILGAASVFRSRFTDDALAVVAERTRGQIQDISRQLVRAYVATRSRNGDVAFFHTTVRDYVYARLGAERRAVLHERAALWYRRQEDPEEAKHHQKAARAAQKESGGA